MTDNSSDLSVSTEWQDGSAVVTVAGEVDLLTVGELEKALAAALEQRPQLLVVDLSGVGFISSSGLSALVVAHKQAGERPGAVRVVATDRAVVRPLEVTALDRVIPAYATRAEALATD